MSKFTVYILYSCSTDKYYIGHTQNLEARIQSHNDSDISLGKYTRKNGPWELVYKEDSFNTRSEAIKRERQIKSWKSRKQIERLVSCSRFSIVQ
ncbi:MAG: GIY-YIG nuclease family protein [Chitinivibrionales bacterium]|nr:GIY-YIG nuclease family protein [Chitinivibrionales bacterium]